MSLNWSDVRYWQKRDDVFQFGYTVKPQQDGKFHAIILKNGAKVKDVPCGRRKVAKARAYHWREKRVETLKKQVEAANERRELRERGKPKLTETEKKINTLKAKINNAQKRQRELLKAIRQSQSRMMRATKAAAKWFRKEQQWIKQMQELQTSTDQRVTAFVKEFKTKHRCQCNKHEPEGCPNEPEPMEEMCHYCLETCTEASQPPRW